MTSKGSHVKRDLSLRNGHINEKCIATHTNYFLKFKMAYTSAP